ncbi:hypothetical protein [uncultured Trichococcus sp.]|uniref:Flp family type IVb pilin n=1 Tax=uncultured Trichococcus sp. TaxID=189665 RepID=UPI0029C62239|nr:hypothetical protein [uncultured Trichococcus sp.]
MEIMKRLVREEEGQGLVEYVMIIAVVVGFGIALGGSGVGTLIKNKITAIIGEAPGEIITD